MTRDPATTPLPRYYIDDYDKQTVIDRDEKIAIRCSGARAAITVRDRLNAAESALARAEKVVRAAELLADAHKQSQWTPNGCDCSLCAAVREHRAERGGENDAASGISTDRSRGECSMQSAPPGQAATPSLPGAAKPPTFDEASEAWRSLPGADTEGGGR